MHKQRLSLDEYVLPGVPYRSTGGDVASAAMLVLFGAILITAEFAPPATTAPALGYPGSMWVVALAGAVLLLFKRRAPLLALTATIALMVTTTVLITGNLPIIPLIALVDVLYAATLYSRHRRVLIGLACSFVILQTAAVIASEHITRAEVGTLLWVIVGISAIAGLPILWGTSVQQRDELLESERQRAEAIALAAEAQRDAAVRAERGEVAAQLHDEIAARLSAISLQAGALGALPDDNPKRRTAIAAMRSSSHEALDELHRLIGVLAEERADEEADVTDPVGAVRAQAAAFGATVHIDGDPGNLPAPVAQGLARIGKEAIANAARHAPHETIRTAFRRDDAAITMTISNPLPATPARTHGSGLGRELMAARWKALGGTGSAGPSGDQWNVTVTLPLTAADAPSP
ncbi:sensor histidine kinase [Microbacterium amylolyticum]|uniref:histidine kinase n=1 Tax=Microbacterium amylolyticum TaxID=936337 RepID=A0ABS4ZI73_9MICO|nr:histidine kinase [Microbacterium amylolyticum]MBP2436969.1 signal transduction histidine kinase [Microbacterium amylolyticum]